MTQGDQTSGSQLRVHRGIASQHVDGRDLFVSLPPGYDANKNQRYPVFYLHDGQNIFDGATSFIPGQEWRVDETAEALIKAGKIEPLIIVGIYNTGNERVNEYTATQDPKYKAGGKGDLGKRQVPLRFPTLARHHRECALQSDTFDEFVQGFADQRMKDAMKMKRRKASDARDLFEPDRPIHIVQDEIDRAIDAVGIVQRLRLVLGR